MTDLIIIAAGGVAFVLTVLALVLFVEWLNDFIRRMW